jgi:hypothetical protein
VSLEGFRQAVDLFRLHATGRNLSATPPGGRQKPFRMDVDRGPA